MDFEIKLGLKRLSLLGCLCGLLYVIVRMVSSPAAAALADAASKGLPSWINLFGIAPAWLARRVPVLVVAFVPCLYSGILLSLLKVWRTLFPPLSDAITPFAPEVSAWDPLWGPGYPERQPREHALPWKRPEKEGDRRFTIYRSLLEFANEEIGSGRHMPFWKPKDLYKPLLFKVLTGRSGSGKTRMAVEFLRDLGQIERMNRTPSRRKRFLMRAGQWWRHVAPGVGRAAHDPWDAGWLMPTSTSNVERHKTRGNLDVLAAKFKGWTPRRPTVLLIDDPNPGDRSQDCSKILDALIENSSKFRYPVRLLIVNQNYPADLDRRSSSAGHEIDSVHACEHEGPLEATEEESWLTKDEIRHALVYSFEQKQASFFNRDQGPSWANDADAIDRCVDRIWTASEEGNPMLVELAVNWTWDNADFDKMTRKALLHDRAKRVYEAFQPIKHEQMLLVASCTIAGPATLVIDDALRAKAKSHSVYDRLEALQRELASWGSIRKEPGNFQAIRLPAVRPLQVGEAFVEYVVAPLAASHIFGDAWELDSRAMLEFIARHAAYESCTGEELRKFQPPAGADPWPLALAFVRAAAQSPAGDLAPALTVEALQQAEDLVSQCTPRQLQDANAVDAVLALTSADRTQTYVRDWAVRAALLFTLQKVLEGSEAYTTGAQLEALRRQWAMLKESYLWQDALLFFANPTVAALDRRLVSLVSEERSHSGRLLRAFVDGLGVYSLRSLLK